MFLKESTGGPASGTMTEEERILRPWQSIGTDSAQDDKENREALFPDFLCQFFYLIPQNRGEFEVEAFGGVFHLALLVGDERFKRGL